MRNYTATSDDITPFLASLHALLFVPPGKYAVTASRGIAPPYICDFAYYPHARISLNERHPSVVCIKSPWPEYTSPAYLF